MASHLTMSLRPSSTAIGFFIGFNLGAAARKTKKDRGDGVILVTVGCDNKKKLRAESESGLSGLS